MKFHWHTVLIFLVVIGGVTVGSVSAAAAADCTDSVTYLTTLSSEWDAYKARIDTDVAGLETFWETAYLQEWGRTFSSPCVYEYVPAEVPFQAECGVTPEIAQSNAFYCVPEHVVMWDGPTFFQPLYNELGDKAVTFIVAHEYGHAVQFLSGQVPSRSVNRELQADCYAGAYLQYAEAQGMITEDDYREIIITVAALGQSRFGSTWFTRSHGTSIQREIATQQGYQFGVAGCQIDFENMAEIRDAVQEADSPEEVRDALEEAELPRPNRPRPGPRR